MQGIPRQSFDALERRDAGQNHATRIWSLALVANLLVGSASMLSHLDKTVVRVERIAFACTAVLSHKVKSVLRSKSKCLKIQVARVAELADALDSGSSE